MTDFDEPPFPPYDPYELDPPTNRASDTPAQDIPAEQAVLGALLLDPHRIPEIQHQLRGSDFWRPAHETIYETITALAAAGQPVDMITVADALTQQGELKRIGGHTYLHDLIEACPITGNADYYASIIRDRARRRLIEQTGTKLVDTARRGDPDDLDKVYDQAYSALDESYNRFGPTRATSTWTPLDLDTVLAGQEVDPPPTLLARDDGHHLVYASAVHTFSGEPGSGKAQPYTAEVQTPTGPRRMGDLTVGDQILGLDGHPQTVEAIYERGAREVWELTTSDGITIECCDEHLWNVQDHNDRARARGWRTLTTRQLAEAGVRHSHGRARWHLPPTGVAQYAAQADPLPLDPYLLGVLLGDGHIGRDVRISTQDPEILAAAVELAPGDLTLWFDGRCSYTFTGHRGHRNPLLATLRDLGLAGSRSHTKHIPAQYLTAPADARLALLQGLMDTDGSHEAGTANFYTVSPQLAADIARLAWSLGGTARTAWSHAHLNGVRHRDRARITIRLPHGVNPFRLPRKATPYSTHSGRPGPSRTITSIRPTGRHVPMRCIAVSNPDHLYLTNGHVPTHNTWITLIAALQQLAAGHQVTMIDFEDRASRVVGRLLALGAHPTAIRERFRYVRPHNPIDATTRPDLDRACAGSSLVILDGVTEAMTLHGLELEKNADVARFYELLPRHIADHTAAAVVMIDHVVKDTEKQGRWALGGSHKLAGIDGAAYLVKAIEPFGRGKTGIARITVSKDRPGYVEEIALGRTVAELHLDARDINCLRHHLQAPTEAPKDEAGNMRPTHLMERVSRYIEITPGLGKNDLLDGRITGKTAYLKRAIDRLIQEGYIEVVPGPNRKQEHRSITPFREDEEETLT